MSKLTDADGEQAETHHWLDTCLACEYISADEQEKLIKSRILGKIMAESGS